MARTAKTIIKPTHAKIAPAAKRQARKTTDARVAELPTAIPTPAEVVEASAPAAAGNRPTGKLGLLVGLLEREAGASLEDMTQATGWQAHSVRGAMSGALKKKLGLTLLSEKTAPGRRYRSAGGEVTLCARP